MKGSNLYLLCKTKKWSEARKYLSSDAAEEEKKSNIMYRNDFFERTSLYAACFFDAPDDIMKAMLDIGGKELVMEVDLCDQTVLHSACENGASYDIIKMLIEVGGKDLVMAKDNNGDTALHWLLCRWIEEHTKAAEKIELILQAGNNTLLLSAKNHAGQTPLDIVTHNVEVQGTSNIIKKLLTFQQMMTQEEGEAPRAAALEAMVETQRLEIADLSNEKDGIEKECMDKIDKLTRKLSKQETEMQLLNNDPCSDVEVGMKRKHTNEEQEGGEDAVVQSQTQSSKKRRVGNARNASSGSLNTNQAVGENAELIDMLMTRNLDTRKQLQRANARVAYFEEKYDETGS
eukprot:scaffold842_cov287-Chaetoceros_neogracile.AAC.2